MVEVPEQNLAEVKLLEDFNTLQIKAEVPKQNLAATTAPQVSTAEPTTLGDHNSKTTAVKHTPKITKKPRQKKIQKPPKPTQKAPLEDEIPEQLLVTTQKSQETIAATSSQQMVERSQPMPETPPASSQKEQVTKILLDALDLNRTQTSPSHSPANENIPQQVTGSDVSIIANPPTTPEEVTPFELQVTLGGSSSEAATTSAEPTGLHLDNGYINKTSLKEISSLGTLVYPVFTGSLKSVSQFEGRSPQFQDKGASVDDFWSTLPESTTVTTTVSGKIR
ncbi:hypothetical protein Hanom_Chr02g00136021 [Helianthus anomalus]